VDLGLRGRVCVVTGSTGGIGLETARLLAAEGARVVVTGRDAARVDESRDAADAELGVVADLGELGAADELIAQAVERVGPVDCLVNNVGVAYQADFLEVTDRDRHVVDLGEEGHEPAIFTPLAARRQGAGRSATPEDRRAGRRAG
jgi:3-oxoacyl-[acyl-carrier protein] reductase